MAAVAAAVVVLALVTVVVTRPSDTAATATPHWVITPSPGLSGMYIDVRVPGPVGRTDRVVLTGDDGARAEVSVGQIGDPQTSDRPGRQNVIVTIHLHNTGRVWIGTRLDSTAWVLDQNGTNYAADPMLSLSGAPSGATDPMINPAWQLQPDFQVDRQVAFTVPFGVQLTRLHIELPMGGVAPTAEWNL